jgi:hypothetical protein
MSRRLCWLYYDEDGYLACRVQHRDPKKCLLWRKEEEKT